MSDASRPRHPGNAPGDAEPAPILVPSGNKARPVGGASPRGVLKAAKKAGDDGRREKAAAKAPPSAPSLSDPTVLRRRDALLMQPNLSMNASFSSDCSTESFCSRASTGRIGSRASLSGRRRQGLPNPERIISKLEKIVNDGVAPDRGQEQQGKRRCAWVTLNTDPCYAAFHDEEWGVPAHDDKKLFELLVLSGALAEHTWPVILSKRQMFRDVFVDFDPMEVAKLNEKKMTAPGSIARSLLSEPKLRAVIENARLIVKIIAEFGSFDQYCWSFVNHKAINGKFRYSRQVPVKTSKADFISKNLIRKGFRCVGPTVVYSFMQAAGLTNDHLITCYRFEECCAATIAAAPSEPDETATAPEQEVTVAGSTNDKLLTSYMFEDCCTSAVGPAPSEPDETTISARQPLIESEGDSSFDADNTRTTQRERDIQHSELDLAATVDAVNLS